MLASPHAMRFERSPFELCFDDKPDFLPVVSIDEFTTRDGPLRKGWQRWKKNHTHTGPCHHFLQGHEGFLNHQNSSTPNES